MNVRGYILTAAATLVAACALLAGCLGDAPRENPLDPRSDDYEGAGALPAFDSVSVRSEHRRRFTQPTDLHALVVEAWVRDFNEQPVLDSVRMRLGELLAPLYEVEEGRYVRSFRVSELPGVERLQAVLGRPVRLTATNEEGHRVRSTPRYLARVIAPSPVADTAIVRDGALRFRWQPAAADRAAPYPFAHTYRITLFRREADIDVQVARYTGLSSERTTFEAERPDRSGSYRWTVAVVDEFGNLSRSRPSAFSLPPGGGG